MATKIMTVEKAVEFYAMDSVASIKHMINCYEIHVLTTSGSFLTSSKATLHNLKLALIDRESKGQK